MKKFYPGRLKTLLAFNMRAIIASIIVVGATVLSPVHRYAVLNQQNESGVSKNVAANSKP